MSPYPPLPEPVAPPQPPKPGLRPGPGHGPGYSADGNVGARQTYPGGGRSDQWHTYAVEWTPTGMRFLVDDRVVQETSRNKLESTRGQWVQAEVDWVRVEQKG